MNLLKKITHKTLGFDKATVVGIFTTHKVKDGGRIEVYRVAGTTSRYGTGETDKGPWVDLRGEFAAQLTLGNDTFKEGDQVFAPRVFPPEPFCGMTAAQLEPKDGKRPSAIEFGIAIFAKRVDSSAVGYEWIVEPVLKVQQADSVTRLLEATSTKTLPSK